jgi:nucleotide-binding universal stress UspA family protein
MQIRHVLVPTDFSEHAEQAVEVAVTMAVQFKAKLTLLHVAHRPNYAYGQRTAQSLDDLLPGAQNALDKATAQVRARCPNVQGLLAQGHPWEAILRFVEEQRVDLVVMGTHGRHGLPRALLGSVTERVLRSSPVPVVAVTLHETAPAAG